MAFKQEINISMVVTTGIVSGLVLVILMLGTQAWFEYEERAESELKGFESPKSEWVVLKDQQAASMERYGWTDAKQNAVTIPIEQAMDMMVKMNGKLPSTQPSS